MTNGSESERPKNMRIRIPNTAHTFTFRFVYQVCPNPFIDDNGILSVTSVEAVFEKTISVEEQEQQEKKDEDTWSKLGDTISQFFAKTDEKEGEGGAAPEEVPAEGEEGKSSADPKANSSNDETTKAKKEKKSEKKEEKKSEKKKEPKKPKVEMVKEELAVEEER